MKITCDPTDMVCMAKLRESRMLIEDMALTSTFIATTTTATSTTTTATTTASSTTTTATTTVTSTTTTSTTQVVNATTVTFHESNFTATPSTEWSIDEIDWRAFWIEHRDTLIPHLFGIKKYEYDVR